MTARVDVDHELRQSADRLRRRIALNKHSAACMRRNGGCSASLEKLEQDVELDKNMLNFITGGKE